MKRILSIFILLAVFFCTQSIAEESDTYYLDWKWISSSNDMEIGTNPSASYGLQIEVKAESVN